MLTNSFNNLTLNQRNGSTSQFYFNLFGNPIKNIHNKALQKENKNKNKNKNKKIKIQKKLPHKLIHPVHKVPVLSLIFGWFGCQPYILQKYVDLHKDLDFNSIPVTDSRLSLLFPLHYGRNFGKRVVQEILDQNLEDSYILFHCFSGHGFYNCCHFLQELRIQKNSNPKAEKLDSNITGIIFDSSPPIPSKQLIIKGVTNSFPKAPNIVKKMVKFGSNVFTKIQPTVLSHSKKIMGLTKTGEFSLEFPQLYLYSKSDNVCPYQEVEEFLANQKKIGNCVESFFWENVPHVQLFRFHPIQYKKLIKDFTDKAIIRQKNKIKNEKEKEK
ncbi:hypothetical protein M0811_12027 [Anaeramoeba ignava]|uniref:Transmembrane protein 53 n=1 Tax=Anaeramoeba ignava TaxID=1746090 RepID=A0A9Q0LCY6_ANAIG|nr:hypothetical protein M0811_12027 [Anaeramoeba ignava]